MDKVAYKEKYKENFKKIGNEALDELEPVVKKTSSNIMDFVKEIFNDLITDLFEMRKKKRRLRNGQN